MKFEYVTGATPLEQDEINDLIPSHIATHDQLNEWEAANILHAENWLFSQSTQKNFLTIDFIKLLHKKMFGDTWKWAGKFRITGKNIGVDAYKITTELTDLLQNVVCQIQHGSYSVDEIAYRFHHRLVWIHPFPNGNGRHARTMTDFLLVQAGQPKFMWGNTNLVSDNLIRKRYIDALKRADKGDYIALANFIRS